MKMSTFLDWNLSALCLSDSASLACPACPSPPPLAADACETPLEWHGAAEKTMPELEYFGCPIGDAEASRLKHVKSLNILDTARESRYDSITSLCAKIFSCPYVIISLQDAERNWFKSVTGLPGVVQVPRKYAMCAWTIPPLVPEVLVVMDMRNDARFRTNGMVAGPPYFRFYAGAPLVSSNGMRLGSLCLSDTNARYFTREDCNLLCNFTELVVREIEAEYVKDGLGGESRPGDAFKNGTMLIKREEGDPHCWTILYVNTLAMEILCQPSAQPLLGRNFWDAFTLGRPHDAPAAARDAAIDDFDTPIELLETFSFAAHTHTAEGAKIRVTVKASSGTMGSLDDNMALLQIPVDLESEDSLKSSLWFMTMAPEGQRAEGCALPRAPPAAAGGPASGSSAALFVHKDVANGRNWSVKIANDGAATLLDCAPGALIGRTVDDLLTLSTLDLLEPTSPTSPKSPTSPFADSPRASPRATSFSAALSSRRDFSFSATAHTGAGPLTVTGTALLSALPPAAPPSPGGAVSRADEDVWCLKLAPAGDSEASLILHTLSQGTGGERDTPPPSARTRGSSSSVSSSLRGDGRGFAALPSNPSCDSIASSPLAWSVADRWGDGSAWQGDSESTSASQRSATALSRCASTKLGQVTQWLHGEVKRVAVSEGNGHSSTMMLVVHVEKEDDEENHELCERIAEHFVSQDNAPELQGFVFRTISAAAFDEDGFPNITVYKETDGACVGNLRQLIHGNEFKHKQTEDDITHGRVAIDYIRVVSVAMQLAKALAAVHAAGIAHGEVTDVTVMVRRSNAVQGGRQPVLFTSGIGRFLQPTLETITDTHDGYIIFFAPERFPELDDDEDLAPATPEADVWSLGVIMPLLCSFSLPVVDLCAVEILELARAGLTPDKVLEVDTGSAPAAYKELARRCLHTDPSQRPTAAEVATALEHVLEALVSTPSNENTPSAGNATATGAPNASSDKDEPPPST